MYSLITSIKVLMTLLTKSPDPTTPGASRCRVGFFAAAIFWPNLYRNSRKLERGFRMISAGIPCTVPYGHEDSDVSNFLASITGAGL